jgi:serine/threonine protein kinase
LERSGVESSRTCDAGNAQGPRSDQRNTLARIALPVARGMEYLHRQNIVHFDLKAENLLCDLRNLDSPVVKIGDMGLSRVKMDSDTYVSGSMRGTIPWMAPELFFVNQTGTLADGQTEGLVTEKVDVFSFGVVRSVTARSPSLPPHRFTHPAVNPKPLRCCLSGCTGLPLWI